MLCGKRIRGIVSRNSLKVRFSSRKVYCCCGKSIKGSQKSDIRDENEARQKH